MKYNDLCLRVKEKGCILDWSEEDYKQHYSSAKTVIPITSSCGHKNTVQISNLLYTSTGVKCKQCLYQEMRENTLNVPKDTTLIEYNAIKTLQEFCDGPIIMKILKEGCLADLCYKPSGSLDDRWLPVQVKTRTHLCKGKFSFGIQNTYSNMFVLLFTTKAQRIWILDGNHIKIDRINIGKNVSIYSKYEVQVFELIDKLISLYKEYTHYLKPLCELDVPITDFAKRELEFAQYRSYILKNVQFEYPELSHREYDFIVNKVYKIQDKVLTKNLKKGNIISYSVSLGRRRKQNLVQYKLGDNDFYYFHLPCKMGAYIIPEKDLYEHELLSAKDKDVKAITITLNPNPSKKCLVQNPKHIWMNKHIYYYDKDTAKIEALFSNTKKPIFIENYTNTIILVFKHPLVAKMVKDMFDQLIPRDGYI
jgi:hypothetical protein